MNAHPGGPPPMSFTIGTLIAAALVSWKATRLRFDWFYRMFDEEWMDGREKRATSRRILERRHTEKE